MLPQTMLLADDAADRRTVLEELLMKMGYQVVTCPTVEACAQTLITRRWPVDGLVGNAWLYGECLLPILEDYCADEEGVFAPCCLWSPEGEDDLRMHAAFLVAQRALVFTLPLDAELLRQVIRLFTLTPVSVKREDGPEALGGWRLDEREQLHWMGWADRRSVGESEPRVRHGYAFSPVR